MTCVEAASLLGMHDMGNGDSGALLNEEVTAAGSGYSTVSVVVVECWVDADLPVTVIV